MISVDPTLAHPIAIETPPRPSRAWRWLKRLTATAALGALGAGTWWLWQAGLLPRLQADAKREISAFAADIGFRVKDVLVVGRQETSPQALLAAVGIGYDNPILDFDAKAAKHRVEALPWVQSATVERVLPDTVVVRVQERQPLAIWQHKGAFHLIDRTGAAIAGAGVERFPHLLQVVGEDAPEQVVGLVRLLQGEPEIAGRVKAAVRVGNRRWNLRLDNGMDVRLPEQETETAWKRLADLQRTHRVLEREVQVLDLRLPDRLIVRRPGDPPPPPPGPGKAQET
ncbi:MAG: FtsQ-type POTRA domain-containing protein [Magnetospirillum sp. WYHS-4]